MSKKLKWIFMLGALVLVIGAAYFAYDRLAPLLDGKRTPYNENAVPAVNFILYDEEGTMVPLFDHLDKPLILNFWASTCGPCRSEMPHFQKAYEELSDEYNFLMLNEPGFLGETQADALAFVAENGYTFPVLFDNGGGAVSIYGLNSLPTTFFIDTDGYLQAIVRGALSEEELFDYIEQIFG